LDKAVSVLGHADLLEPLRHLLHIVRSRPDTLLLSGDSNLYSREFTAQPGYACHEHTPVKWFTLASVCAVSNAALAAEAPSTSVVLCAWPAADSTDPGNPFKIQTLNILQMALSRRPSLLIWRPPPAKNHFVKCNARLRGSDLFDRRFALNVCEPATKRRQFEVGFKRWDKLPST
jgi:hypothetical protein